MDDTIKSEYIEYLKDALMILTGSMAVDYWLEVYKQGNYAQARQEEEIATRLQSLSERVPDDTLFEKWQQWYPSNVERFDTDDGDMICFGRMLSAFVEEHGYLIVERALASKPVTPEK